MPRSIETTETLPAVADATAAVQPPQAVKPPAAQAPSAEGPGYQELKAKFYVGKDALTYTTLKKLLGMETEDEFRARIAKRDGLDEKAAKEITFESQGVWPLYANDDGTKVIFWHNAGNRPFDPGHAAKLSQVILRREWAGEVTMPGETVNGEPVIVSRKARVKSGQHRGAGLFLAVEEYRRNPEKWKHLWPAEPVLETLIVFGVSDHEKVTATLDNTKARTEADTFFTGNATMRILGEHEAAKLSPKGKAEICRMLQATIDFLWQRIGMNKRLIQTHPEVQAMLDRHTQLHKAVKHIFEENKDRQISILRLSPGACAASMYLMAASKSNPNKHRATDSPEEKMLDLGLWEKAKEFWRKLAAREGQLFILLADALASLHDPDTEGSATSSEKFGLIAKAWGLFVAGKNATPPQAGKNGKPVEGAVSPDFKLKFVADDKGITRLVDVPTFGGIDYGPTLRKVNEPSAEPQAAKPAPAAPKPSPTKPTAPVAPKPAAQLTEEQRKANASKAAESIKARRTNGEYTAPAATPASAAPTAAPAAATDGKPPAPKLLPGAHKPNQPQTAPPSAQPAK